MKSYPTYNDLEKCEDEPIAFYPKIQRHGCVLILDRTLQIKQVSTNTEDIISIAAEDLLNVLIKKIVDEATFKKMEQWLHTDVEFQYLTVNFGGKDCIVAPKKTKEGLVLDIELADKNWDEDIFQQKLLRSFKTFFSAPTLSELLVKASIEIRQLIGFDRVMIYQFDKDWNGHIVSESRNSDLESWLGLHYPARDVPKNARDLFQKMGVRSLSNVTEEYAKMVPKLHPDTGELTNLGNSQLRGSSPFHIEYLTNMGVAATLNCAIIHNHKLWGLIAGHHYTPKKVGYLKRQSCQLLAEMFSSQISIKISGQTFEGIERMSSVRQKLMDSINSTGSILDGLTAYKVTGKDLVDCSDFIVGFDTQISSVSNTLPDSVLQRLVLELFREFPDQDCIVLDSLLDYCPWMVDYVNDVSGVLLFKVSKRSSVDYMLWLRPEKLKEVNWGGEPTKKSLEAEKSIRLSPRKSFDKWVEKVKHTSESWTPDEISISESLVEDVRNIIVTKFTEVNLLNRQLSDLNRELESFSYSVSHDLRGPLRGIDGFAQILIEDYGEILDDYGKESLDTIIKSCAKMNELMDDILGYSGIAKLDRIDQYHNVANICNNIVKEGNFKGEFPNTTLTIQDNIPDIYGDKSMIYQLFSNLLTNAFKYSSKVAHPEVNVGYKMEGDAPIYHIKDNGIGFNPDYATKIFGVFTRLVKEEYKGTGVGLAIAQRVVLKHNGQIWANGALGKGAIFKFRFGD
ncbi:ATP-binding protein [Aquimarina sp. ERC-38]|uniref:ATP-binding protein n=1 Tax=Aquimarina sp. ERC-38 TaxID=2949996 RepID=UPI002247621B|nr:ATP-binding protein [Aquimarina sp. ERC-38]UZO80364.1 ATP-binding protein [Aquimarina sp. ERC-38]